VDNLVDAVRGVDALVIEGRIARGSRARQGLWSFDGGAAAQLARDAGVKQLILTHVSRRYPSATCWPRPRDFSRDAGGARLRSLPSSKGQNGATVIAAPAEEETDVDA